MTQPSKFKHVVIGGGAGFIGRHLSERFISLGCRVSIVDNFSTASSDSHDRLRALGPKLQIIHQNIIDPISIPGHIDAVYHLASPASPKDYARLPEETLLAGSIGTLNLLKLAGSNDARFVLASTSEVYGDPLVHPQTESYWGNVNPVGPRSVYDEAKRYAEALAMAIRQSRNTNVGIVRIFNTYGPGMRYNDGRAVPEFIARAISGFPILIHGSGEQTRSFQYISDLVSGLVKFGYVTHAGPVNMGNPHEVRVLALAKLVRRLADSTSEITQTTRLVDDPVRRCPDIALAARLLAWHPVVPLEVGLAQTIRDIRERKDLVEGTVDDLCT